MDDIKEKLLLAIEDGALDSTEVLSKLIEYSDDDTIMDMIEGEGWQDTCGIGIQEIDDDDM